MAGALLEAGRTAGAQRFVQRVARRQLDDRLFGTGSEAVVAFEADTATQAALRFVPSDRFGQAGEDLGKIRQPVGVGQTALGRRIDIAEHRKMQHFERGYRWRLSWRVDLAAQKADRAGHPLNLTAKELALLVFFLRHPGEVLSRTRIYGHVWGEDYDFVSNTLDVHVKELRRALESRGPRLIQTVRGRGYVLGDPPAPAVEDSP